MRVHIQGPNFFNKRGGGLFFDEPYLNSIIDPNIKIILEKKLDIEQIIMYSNYGDIPYRARTITTHSINTHALTNYLLPDTFEDFSNTLVIAFGASSQKASCNSINVLLKDKNKMSIARKDVVHEEDLRHCSKNKFITNGNDDDEPYYRVRFYGPRRKRDKKHTLYFNFSDYKDLLTIHSDYNVYIDYKAIPIAEISADSIENNLENIYNVIYVLVDLSQIIAVNQELGTKLFNTILHWYLFVVREIDKVDCKKLILENMARNTLSLEKFDCNEGNQRLVKDYIRSCKTTIKRLQQSLKEEEEKLLKNEKKLKDMEEAFASQSVDESAYSDFVEISNFDIVKSIELNPNCKEVYLYTNMIYIIKENFRYKIGEFKLSIPYVSVEDKERYEKDGHSNSNIYSHNVSDRIVFENLTPNCKRLSYWGNRCNHPHVSNQGKACFGNAKNLLAECLNSRDYIGVVTILLDFLQQANTRDAAGKFITSWDVVDENDNIVYPGYRYDSPPPELKTLICQVCQAEAVANTGIVKEVHIDESEETYMLCKDCIEAIPHVCGTCGCIFTEYKSDGTKYPYTKQCQECGKWFCGEYCMNEGVNDITPHSVRDDVRECILKCSNDGYNICTDCAHKKVLEINKLQEYSLELPPVNINGNEMNNSTIIATTYTCTTTGTPYTYIGQHDVSSMQIDVNHENNDNEDDVCPDCGTSWENHYHCIICGDPMCDYDGSDGYDGSICNICREVMEIGEMLGITGEE